MRKVIAPSSRHFFEGRMEGHTAVSRITHLGNDVYLIERTDNRPAIRVLIADIYITGECDISEISYEYHDIDCIVLVGFYNRYSCAAKEYARDLNLGLYDCREFMGAVNCTGMSFLYYKRREE